MFSNWVDSPVKYTWSHLQTLYFYSWRTIKPQQYSSVQKQHSALTYGFFYLSQQDKSISCAGCHPYSAIVSLAITGSDIKPISHPLYKWRLHNQSTGQCKRDVPPVLSDQSWAILYQAKRTPINTHWSKKYTNSFHMCPTCPWMFATNTSSIVILSINQTPNSIPLSAS